MAVMVLLVLDIILSIIIIIGIYIVYNLYKHIIHDTDIINSKSSNIYKDITSTNFEIFDIGGNIIDIDSNIDKIFKLLKAPKIKRYKDKANYIKKKRKAKTEPEIACNDEISNNSNKDKSNDTVKQ